MPLPLPAARCALTAPFHPYRGQYTTQPRQSDLWKALSQARPLMDAPLTIAKYVHEVFNSRLPTINGVRLNQLRIPFYLTSLHVASEILRSLTMVPRVIRRLCRKREDVMYSAPLTWNQSKGWQSKAIEKENPDLVLYFGSREMLADGARYQELRAMFPKACLMGCTTGGQIHGDELDDDLNAIALRFDATKIRATSVEINDASDSRRCGEEIGRKLAAGDLAGVFVLVGRLECQRQRTGGRHQCASRRRIDYRRPGRRRCAICRNARWHR